MRGGKKLKKEKKMKQKKIYCMALGIAAYVLASGCGSESTARSVATPLWLKEGEDLKDPQNLGAPVNHEGHTKIQFPGDRKSVV